MFYTGDLRAHGLKARLFDELLADPRADIDVLLMEGTHVRTDENYDNAEFATESDLENQFIELCHATAGAVGVFGSGQNRDRIVTLRRSAFPAGRTFVLDLYGATVSAATRPTMPCPATAGMKVYVPNRQRIRVKLAAAFRRVQEIKSHRIYPETMADAPGKLLLHMPSSTLQELIKTDVPTSMGVAVWSLWHGYLTEPSGQRLTRTPESADVPMVYIPHLRPCLGQGSPSARGSGRARPGCSDPL